MIGTRRVIAATAVSLALGAGCSGNDQPDLSLPDDAGAPAGDDITSTEARDAVTDRGETVHVAQALGPTLVVRESAQASGEKLVTLSAADEVSGVIVCVVVQQVGDWVEVRLPSGAFDRTGWVDRADIALSRHRFSIEVSRTDRSLTLYEGDTALLTTQVALGPDAPPAGRHLFVKELIRPPDPAGPFGPYAYGLSGSDNDLDDFRAGAGVVAVHGTSDAAVLGADTPAGSIGVGSDVVTRMVDAIGLPLGTPVDIVE
jgi:hypothetical protein